MILVFGDSHAAKFRDFAHYNDFAIAGLTAHGFSGDKWMGEEHLGFVDNPTPSDVAREHWHGLVNIADFIVLILGEVDCRMHFYYHHMMDGTPISDLINVTVTRYCSFVSKVEKPIVVCDVVPAVAQGNVYNFAHYGSREQRAQITVLFNQALENECLEKGLPFVKIHHLLADENGFLKSYYAMTDDCHASASSVWLIEEQLKALFPQVFECG